jgi:hypothetical protein
MIPISTTSSRGSTRKPDANTAGPLWTPLKLTLTAAPARRSRRGHAALAERTRCTEAAREFAGEHRKHPYEEQGQCCRNRLTKLKEE